MGRNKLYNKEDVLEKALITFWSKGFENTSMRDLSKSTGINSFSLYSEFKDKESLFKEVLKTYQSRNLLLAESILSNDKSGFESIRDFFSKLIESIKGETEFKGCLTTKTATSPSVLNHSIKEIITEYDDKFIALFTKVIEEGQQDGSIKKELASDDLAYFVYNTHHGILTLETTIGNKTKLENIVNAMLSFIRA